MAYVNYVKECIAFMEYAADERISASEQSLWHTLFHLMNQRANGSDWPEDFISIPNARVLLYMNVEEDTMSGARNRLVQRGLIEYKKGERNKRSPQYKMHYFHAELSTGYAQNGESYTEKSGNDRGNDRGNRPNFNVNYNRNPNRIPNACEDDVDADADMEAYRAMRECVVRTFREEMGRDPMPAETRTISMSAINNNMERDLVVQSIARAAVRAARNPAPYIEETMRRWASKGICTVYDMVAQESMG